MSYARGLGALDLMLPDGTSTQDADAYRIAWNNYYHSGLPITSTFKDSSTGITYGYDASGNIVGYGTQNAGDVFHPTSSMLTAEQAAAVSPRPSAPLTPSPATAPASSPTAGYVAASDVNKPANASGINVGGFDVPWWALAAGGAALLFFARGK